MRKVKFNKWFKRQRLDKLMTQQEFGDYLGITKMTVVNIENDKHNLSLKTKRLIQDKLAISIKEINEMTGE